MKKIVSVEMPVELFNRVRDEAKLNLTTTSAQIRLILLQYYKMKDLKQHAEKEEEMLGN